MLFQTLIVFGLAATQAQAVSCWKSGPAVSVANIQNHIGTICGYLQSPGYLKGEEHYQCAQDDAGIKWDFALTNIGDDASRPITQVECENGMNKQIQCEFGGETSYGNWKYRHGVFAGDTNTSVTLLVDFKTNGTSTYAVLLEQLEPLRSQGFLTRFNGSDVITGPVTVVGTGNAPFDLIAPKSDGIDRDIFFDAPLDKLWGSEDGGTDAAKYTAQNSYYASVAFNKAIGIPWLWILSPTQVDKLRGQIREAKMRGLKARYWSTPTWPIGLREHIWGILVREEVGMLNVDDLEAASSKSWR